MNKEISISNLLTPEDLPKEFSYLETSVNEFLQDVKYDFHEVASTIRRSLVS